MITVSESVANKFKKGCFQKARFMSNGVAVLTSSSIMENSLKIDRKASCGTDIEIGSVISTEITFTMYCKSGWTDIFGDNWFTLQIGISGDSGTEWIDMGQFRVCDFEPSARQADGTFTAKVTMFDKMDMLNISIPATSALKQHKTLAQHLTAWHNEAIGNKSSGLPVVQPIPSYWSSQLFKLGDECFENSQYSYRDALSDIAELMGGVAYFDENGVLNLTAPGKSAVIGHNGSNVYTPNSIIDVNSNVIMSNDIANDIVPESHISITGVSYQPRETDITYTTGNMNGKIIEITDNALIADNGDTAYEGVAAHIGGLYNGYNYRTGSITTLGMPFIMPYDILNVNNTVKLLVMHCNHTINGNSVMETTGNSDMSKSKVFTDAQNNVMNIVKKTLTSKVSKGDIISEINQSAETVQIKAEKIELDGETIADKLIASSAKIGGWTIKDSKIYAGDGTTIKTAAVQAPASNNMWVFAAGGSTHDTYNDCPFRVDRYGRLYCTQANVSGTVTATGGKIGGWTISTDGKLTTQKEIYIVPGVDEFRTIHNYVLASSDEKPYIIPTSKIPLYDFNCDGQVTDYEDTGLADTSICVALIQGTMTFEEVISNYGFSAQKSTVTITIDPTNPAKVINITGTNMWGRTFSTYLGVGSPFMEGLTGHENNLTSDTFDFLLTSNLWLNELLNSKADDNVATQTQAGLMSAADKTKLDNIPSSSGTTSKVLTVQANGSQVFTFNGSAAKTLNIKAGTNVTITSDTNGNITINSKGGTSSGDIGDVLYESSKNYGLYCDGNTTMNSNNSYTLNDPNPNGSYKRFRIYVRSVYGLACTEMPVDRAQGAANATWGSYQGGIVFPTGDTANGATTNYLVKMHWRVVPPSSGDLGWKFQVTDSGWVNLGTGTMSASGYSGNSTAGITNAAPTWNQRHNSDYSVYKIVGYTV